MTRHSHRAPSRHVAGSTPAGDIPKSFIRSAPGAITGIMCVGVLGAALFAAAPATSASALSISDFGGGSDFGGYGGGYDFGGYDFGGYDGSGGAYFDSVDFGGVDLSETGALAGESFSDGVSPDGLSSDGVSPDGPRGVVTVGPLVVVSINGVPVDAETTETQPSLGFPDPSGLDASFVGQGIEGGDSITGGIKGEGVFFGQGVRGYIGTDGVSYSLIDAYGIGANASFMTAPAMPPSGMTYEGRATFEVGIFGGNVTGTLGPDSPTVSSVGVTLNAGGFRAGVSGDLQNAPTPSVGWAPSLGLGASLWGGRVDTISTGWAEIGASIPDLSSQPNLGFPDPSGLDTSFVGNGAAPESTIGASEPFRVEIVGYTLVAPEETAVVETPAMESSVEPAAPIDGTETIGTESTGTDGNFGFDSGFGSYFDSGSGFGSFGE